MFNATPTRHTNRADITRTESLYLTAVAARLPGRWMAQADYDDLGHRTMALTDLALDENAPVILIWRESGTLQLGIGIAETYLPLGTHADIRSLVRHIHATLARLGAVDRWIGAELSHFSALPARRS